MTRSWLIGLAGVSGAMAVIAGAFGAHGAAGKPAEWLHTGAEYQLLHVAAALALLTGGRRLGAPAFMLGGSALFALTLYLMALGGPRWLGAVTPLGGLVMIAGWIMLAWQAFATKDHMENRS